MKKKCCLKAAYDSYTVLSISLAAVTAQSAFEENRKMAFSKGMDEHIAKPIDAEKVEEVLISIFELSNTF